MATINHKRTLHHGRVFEFTVENVHLDNDVTIDLEIIRHPGASAVVPITEEGAVILIKQYRHAVANYIWEIPAGTFDGKEDPLACARRELIEETGFAARRWQRLGAVTPVPGYSDERIHLFMARDLTPAKQRLDHDEILQVHTIAFDQVMEMIFDGQIEDAKTIAGILLAMKRRDS
ncbi:MAG: NUDIX hydrolase [Desulfatitalea sp.]|nr:NUDIX hydrolase [Desulfatitalea sp.]NNK02123.1 NUDIX hydrolase [Desulfatitalea sp.]